MVIIIVKGCGPFFMFTWRRGMQHSRLSLMYIVDERGMVSNQNGIYDDRI